MEQLRSGAAHTGTRHRTGSEPTASADLDQLGTRADRLAIAQEKRKDSRNEGEHPVITGCCRPLFGDLGVQLLPERDQPDQPLLCGATAGTQTIVTCSACGPFCPCVMSNWTR